MNAISETQITLHNGIKIPLLGYRVDKDHKESIYANMIQADRQGREAARPV